MAENPSWLTPETGMFQTLAPRLQDLGGFSVGRLLPAAVRRSVGPFVFVDRMGPADFPSGSGIDVRPHPHIGLATLTYLFEGEIAHRDSLGSVQDIRPGDVNWMTAGRGIVHSERTPVATRAAAHRLDGLQCWLALPRSHEEVAPSFLHFAAESLPCVEAEGVSLRLVAGHGFGRCAPVPVFSGTLFADLDMPPGTAMWIPAEHAERAVYPVTGEVTLDGQPLACGQLHVLDPDIEPQLAAASSARLVLLGGEPLDAPRHLWWNFVSSSRERIEQAKADWRDERFDPVPGESERIPLPER